MIEHTNEGKDVNLKVYGPDDVFGLLAISGTFPHREDIVSVGYSEIVGFDGHRRVMQAYPDVAIKVIDVLVAHVHHAHSRIRHMAAEKTEQRLAQALLHFCHKFGQQRAKSGQLEAHFSQQDIAEFIGTIVETVNRIFREWEKQGYIARQRLQITVRDADALRHIADDFGELGMGYLVEQCFPNLEQNIRSSPLN